MATRVVEWKKPYTWGKAISIDENKVISLNLRDENNLIIYDAGDDEIYVDLQLDDEITPTSAFPIWVNVGRVIVDNWWDKPWTIISAETTSGDNIKIFYADEWTLWIDNWTGTFKQIYFKADVDALLLALRNYIDWELAKKQNWVSSDTAPENPSEWDLWYDTTNSAMKVWDWTAWQSVGTGWGGSDIEYVTQAEYNALLPWALTDNKHYFIYSTNGWWGWWQPWANTVAYWKFNNSLADEIWNYNGANSWATITYSDLPWDSSIKYANISATWINWVTLSNTIWLEWGTQQTSFTFAWFFKLTSASSWFNRYTEAGAGWAITEFGYGNFDNITGMRLCTWNWWFQPNVYQYPLDSNTWYWLVWTYDHTTRTKSYYVDGVLVWAATASLDYVTTSNLNKSILARGYKWGISNCVFETNTAWTAQDVSNFHNAFKSLYWIS